jgi:hypothetical protein
MVSPPAWSPLIADCASLSERASERAGCSLTVHDYMVYSHAHGSYRAALAQALAEHADNVHALLFGHLQRVLCQCTPKHTVQHIASTHACATAHQPHLGSGQARFLC